jgi:hypothetical protein
MNKTNLLCPACQRELNWEQGFIFCGFGPCPSKISNDGARGETLAIAFFNLKMRLDCELSELDGVWPFVEKPSKSIGPKNPNWENSIESFLCKN